MKIRIYFIILFIMLISLSNLYADELNIIEKAINIAHNRLTQGLFVSEISNEKEFEEQAGKQIEFALISLNSRDLITDDWHSLCVYCLARKHKYFNLAISILKEAYNAENYPKLRKWIKKRIDLLEKYNLINENFDINKELKDLRKNVF